MSLYKSTNEMFNNSSLYHSDEYLGEDYTDGIKHWKYYRREKLSNGKWRYYYRDKNDLIYTSDSKKDDEWGGNIGKYAKYTHVDQYGNKHTIQRKKGNRLLTGHHEKSTSFNERGVSTKEVLYDSKLDRAIDRGMKKVNKLLKKFGKKLRKVIPRSIID